MTYLKNNYEVLGVDMYTTQFQNFLISHPRVFKSRLIDLHKIPCLKVSSYMIDTQLIKHIKHPSLSSIRFI